VDLEVPLGQAEGAESVECGREVVPSTILRQTQRVEVGPS
jgi:hypothetical protein